MTNRDDVHRSVNDRIRIAAQEREIDANRLRRAVVFHRLLARLAPHGLVLKGGYCLEVRLPDVARATRDLDLVGHLASVHHAEALLDSLDTILTDSTQFADGFTFRLGRATPLRDGSDAPNAWRVEVVALLSGTRFEQVKLDLVGQLAEVSGATELLVVPPPIALPGWSDVEVEAVDVYQHAAEKLHAVGRLYAHDRPSSRVKDLVDLVLLVEAGLLTDHARLRSRLVVVHRQRDGAGPPPEVPSPPADWLPTYAGLASQVGLTTATVGAAHDLIARLYAATLTEGDTR